MLPFFYLTINIMIKKEYLGQTVTRNGVSVVVSNENIKVLRMLGITHVFEAPERPKMTFPKVDKVEKEIEEVPLHKLSKTELRDRAEVMEVEGYETMTKNQLIDALL